MGKEINTSQFSLADFSGFEEALRGETGVLQSWFNDGRFVRSPSVGGYELEAWLVDAKGDPAPVNDQFLDLLCEESVVPELSRFNVELNAPPELLTGRALRNIEAYLKKTWDSAGAVADAMGIRLAMIGILPTVSQIHLTLSNMSDRERFRALNEQVLRIRNHRPLQLNIAGSDSIRMQQSDVMLEAAATSFQIHLQVNENEAARYYNAAQVLSAPIVAASTNSPFLFGKSLWAETRIPLFEQAVNVQSGSSDQRAVPPRVTFGHGYVKNSLLELFVENLECHPVLLPAHLSRDNGRLEHLRLHNGTIWRWNRPLIGFSDHRPHLRIENRVVPAGPSIPDLVANAAFFFGLVHALVADEPPIETELPFECAQKNFYSAARYGLEAAVEWRHGARGSVRSLVLEKLLPDAARSLERLDFDVQDIDHYLGIVERRVRLRRTGTDWQRAFQSAHCTSMEDLTAAYLERQESGRPVCEWDTKIC